MVKKQQIHPGLVNAALQKLAKNNPFYSNTTIDNEWDDFSDQLDPVLWKLLTNKNTDKNARESNNSHQIDSDDDVEGNERELNQSSPPFPTVMYNVDGPNISPSKIVNIAPGEGQIPVSFTSEPNWEALAFPKEYSAGRNHFNEEREIPITPPKYVHARLKCCDDRFAANLQYIFHALDWTEKNVVESSIHFVERKQFQSEINVSQLVNDDNVRRMISDYQISLPLKTSEELHSTFAI